ncbi:polymorphic toxin type 17 domain-containing protein [Longispora albida]
MGSAAGTRKLEAFEWGVQLSRRGAAQLGKWSPDGKHLNVSLKGRVTH